jgi:hypothetical protein
MIIGAVYLILFILLIRYNAFFGWFKDEVLSGSKLAIVFFLKALAVPVMYLLYSKLYGGIENFDSGVFFHDAAELNRLALRYPMEYLKAMAGLQDDSAGSFFFEQYTKNTFNWDNGRIRILFYNDNRIVIRLHSIIHFFAFGSYFVHALFSCFLSYLGIFWIYRSLKSFFTGREFTLLCVLSLFPALWIHTGALLKEGIAVFVMGAMMYTVFQFINGKRTRGNLVLLFVLFYISLLLKPYLLLYSLLCFSLLFLLQKTNITYKSLVFTAVLISSLCVFDLGVRFIKNKSLLEIAHMRQVVFSDAAKGGIFLIDSVKFIRIHYDISLVTELPEKKGYYTIKKNVPYMYWEHTHQQDTFVCAKNIDTSSIYQLAYTMPESSSNLSYPKERKPLFFTVLDGFYYTLLHPLFFNARSIPQQLASFENLLLVFALVISFYGLLFSRRASLPSIAFLCFALGECLLIAFTSPNTGAIVRYRSPAVVYILLCALYYLPDMKFLFSKTTTK